MNYPVTPMFLPPQRGNHPNTRFEGGKAAYITVHETANPAPTADARAHGHWLQNAADYSWHETVDDKEVVQHLKASQQGWHAGDGRDGPGNTTSLGIELCVAEGMNFEQVREIAAHRIAFHMQNGHGYEGVVQHHHWTEKDCPRYMRREPGAWQRFIDRIQYYLLAEEPMLTDDELKAALKRIGWADDVGPTDNRLRSIELDRYWLAGLAFDKDANRVQEAVRILKETEGFK